MMSRYVKSSTEIRAHKMLKTLGTFPALRKKMEENGYTQADHQEGWDLYLAIGGYNATIVTPVAADESVRAAFAKLASFATQDLPGLALGVKRKHPEHYDALFAGLTLAHDADAMVETGMFLERYEAMAGKGKKNHHALIAFLATRGFTPSVASALRRSLEVARSAPEMKADPNVDAKAKREVDIERLRAWVEDWSTVARRVIKRKDELHRLGIGRRAKKAGDAASNGGVATPAPPPVAAPAAAAGNDTAVHAA